MNFPELGGYTLVRYWYEWHCAFCNASHRETTAALPGNSITVPSLPAGWMELRPLLCCPLHKVSSTVFVDGKLAVLAAS